MITKFDPAAYPRNWTHPPVPIPEHEAQAVIVEALQAHGLQVWVIDAGGAGIRGKLLGVLVKFGISRDLALRIAKAVFGAAPTAWPDLFTILPLGQACFIEVKRPACWDPCTGRKVQDAGVPTTNQLRFLEAAAKRGAAAGVAWHPKDALRIAGLRG
jgi:hypothetical protein